MEDTVNIVEFISSLLDSEKYKEALSVHNEEKYANTFKDNCWDLISIIVSKIEDDTVTLKPSLHGTCEQLLSIIVQKASPEEALLQFIEQIEVAKNDAQFSIVLGPLQQLLMKLSVKRGRSLEWSLNSISTYIEAIPTVDFRLEGKERLLMDCNTNIRRIIKVYSLIPPFYNPLIKELHMENSNLQTKEIIAAFLISLLGKPLVYLDLDPDSNAQSEARQCCVTIIQDLCTVIKDILKFLKIIDVCSKEAKNKEVDSYMENEIVKTPYDNREKLNITTLSGLYYAIYSGHFEIPEFAVPQVYQPEYIVHTLLLCVIHLLSYTEYGPVSKGIALCKSLLSRLPNDSSHSLLSVPVHYDLCQSLINIAIYSNTQSMSKEAVHLINYHTNKFNYKGRSMLIKFLLQASNHSGLIGYAITLYKNMLNEAFKLPEIPESFRGSQLLSMIQKICYLPNGAESDLVELADQIITSLNFLRYLALRDTNNLTGIRECFSTIESDYLEKLRTGLNLSRAHYEIKKKDLEEGKDITDETANVSINVGGNILDKIPIENKKEIINSALNAFHLIEGLVARVTECINMNKMHQSNINKECQ